MKHYSIINQYDGNDIVNLSAGTELEALYEAVAYLGYGLTVTEEGDEKEKSGYKEGGEL